MVKMTQWMARDGPSIFPRIHGWRKSMLSLTDILSPVETTEFLAKVWNRASLHIPGNDGKFKDLFNWGDFNQVLSQHRLDSPRIRLELNGRSEEELAFLGLRPARKGGQIPYIDIPLLYSHLNDGATLVVDSIDECNTNISRLCEALTRELEANAEANIYAAWKNSPGFGLHWDDHDLFVLQLSGKKHWSLYGPAREYPLYRDTDANVRPPTEILWEKVISAGDVVYIPRGHWHSAIGMNEPTLHVTIGINNPTGIDMLTWFVDELRAKVECRRDIPRFLGPSTIAEYTTHLKAIVDSEWDDHIYERYDQFRKATTQQRMHFSFPFGATSDILPDSGFAIRYVGTTHSSIKVCDSDPSLLEFNALGRNWKFDIKARSLLDLILKGTEVDYDYLKNNPDIPSVVLDQTLIALVEQGLIYISRYSDTTL